jgi:hypothetical protein
MLRRKGSLENTGSSMLKIANIMKTRIFISRPDSGWQEVEIPEFYTRYSYDALIKVAHRFLGDYDYKGLWFTENPDMSFNQEHETRYINFSHT